MKKVNIYVIIPSYNEEKSIRQVVKSVASYCTKIVVVDDGSNDNTYKMAKHKKSIVLRHLCNLGQGAALQTGFDWALGHGADIVVTFDADGQFKSSDIPHIVDPILTKKAEVVLGSRFLGSTEGMSIWRYIVLKLGICFTYIFSGIKLSDTHNGLRAFAAKSLRLINLTQNRMAHASEIIDQIARGKVKWVERPVTVRYNRYSKQKGQKNINALSIVSDLIFDVLN